MQRQSLKFILPALLISCASLGLSGCNGSESDTITESGSNTGSVASPAPAPTPTPTPVASPTPSAPTAPPAASPTSTAAPFQLLTPEPGREQVSLATELVITLEGAATELHDAFALVAGSEVLALDFSSSAEGRFTARPSRLLRPETEYELRQIAPIVTADGVLEPGPSWRFTTTEDLADTPQSVIDGCMNEDAIYTLAQINAVRTSGIACGADNMPAVSRLRYSCQLQQAALRHSKDMSDADFFSHTGSDGSRAGNRVDATGYTWRTWGENIAAGQIDASHAFAELLASPGHCRNMMSAGFAELGFALFTGSGEYRRYWTQVFATPR